MVEYPEVVFAERPKRCYKEKEEKRSLTKTNYIRECG
jgi:hypothetical protein